MVSFDLNTVHEMVIFQRLTTHKLLCSVHFVSHFLVIIMSSQLCPVVLSQVLVD